MKYNRNNKSISGRLHDELVMMNIEQGKYFSLNPIATRVWDLLENPLSLEELVQPLLDEYDVDESQCMADVRDYLEQMEKLGLVFSEGA